MQEQAFQFQIKEDKIETVVRISQQIPEFSGPPLASKYHERLDGVAHLILVAYDGDLPIGFKVGYQREHDFYSWMGAILPDYRRKGVAKKLAQAQEKWVKGLGISTLTFKTRNQHKGMLLFALKNGFDIIGFKTKEKTEENRILLQKQLK